MTISSSDPSLILEYFYPHHAGLLVDHWQSIKNLPVEPHKAKGSSVFLDFQHLRQEAMKEVGLFKQIASGRLMVMERQCGEISLMYQLVAVRTTVTSWPLAWSLWTMRSMLTQWLPSTGNTRIFPPWTLGLAMRDTPTSRTVSETAERTPHGWHPNYNINMLKVFTVILTTIIKKYHT